ncbi:hypothetical protein JCM11641_007349 [Rhodosporidiobolus odoratus]
MDPSTLSAGITTTTALSLASSIRHSTSIPPTFLSGLDALLDSTSTPPLRRGDVVELQGLPSSGKTSLLLQLASTTLLPRQAYVRFQDLRGGPGVAQVEVGGKEETVAFLDCSARAFPVLRLAGLVRRHLELAIQRYRRPQGLGKPAEEELDALVEEALSRLHVFKPSSTLQLARTVANLKDWSMDRARSNGEDEAEVGLVIVDGMSEFAWADQLAREEEQVRQPPQASSSPPSTVPPLRQFLSAVASLRRTLSPLIFISQWVFRPFSVVSSPDQPGHLHHQTSQESLPFYQHHFSAPHWPVITAPPFPAPSITKSKENPLEPLLVGSGSNGGKWESFPIALQIMMHPPEKMVFRKGVTWEEVMRERGGEEGQERTEGIRCVVRLQGGRELGSWEMSVGEDEVES